MIFWLTIFVAALLVCGLLAGQILRFLYDPARIYPVETRARIVEVAKHKVDIASYEEIRQDAIVAEGFLINQVVSPLERIREKKISSFIPQSAVPNCICAPRYARYSGSDRWVCPRHGKCGA